MKFSSPITQFALSLLLIRNSANAQTYSTCNPLTSSSCPADTALGKSISVDFTQGAVDSFGPSGTPTYGSDGVSFTVAKSGDAPQLISLFYIMFGKVEVTMKAAPGAGIVSSLVLQSDCLDEIDFEWLGADDSEVQTNYFGKGDVTTYNRGAYSPATNNQGEFIKYTIEWTSEQIIWSVGGSVVRVLTPATADTNQYPQTPMQVKFGAWSGGDPSNPAGTIAWARGPTDYSQGPFSMIVQSIAVADYSTGTKYTYSDQSGAWTSIKSDNGVIGATAPEGGSVATPEAPSATSASPSIPAGIGGGDVSTRTGWPWVQTAVPTTATPSYSSIAGIPSGWTVSGNGKIVPASTAATTTSPTSFYSPDPSLSSSWLASSGIGSEITTTAPVPTYSSETKTVSSVTNNATTVASSTSASESSSSSSSSLSSSPLEPTTLRIETSTSVTFAMVAPATNTADANRNQAIAGSMWLGISLLTFLQ